MVHIGGLKVEEVKEGRVVCVFITGMHWVVLVMVLFCVYCGDFFPSFLSLLSTRLTSHTVPPIVVTKDPLEWTGGPEAHTIRVLPSVSKWWTCRACGDTAVYATQYPLWGGY